MLLLQLSLKSKTCSATSITVLRYFLILFYQLLPCYEYFPISWHVLFFYRYSDSHTLFPAVGFNMFGRSKSRKKSGLDISSPSNFQHRVHTGFDREHGVFVGLPAQWAGIIGNENTRRRPIVDPSGVTQMEVAPLKVMAG